MMALGVPTGPSDLSGLEGLSVLGLLVLGGRGCRHLCQGACILQDTGRGRGGDAAQGGACGRHTSWSKPKAAAAAAIAACAPASAAAEAALAVRGPCACGCDSHRNHHRYSRCHHRRNRPPPAPPPQWPSSLSWPLLAPARPPAGAERGAPPATRAPPSLSR